MAMSMGVVDGVILALLSAAVTLAVVAVAAVGLVAMKIHEERRGTDCPAAGCRRRRPGKGCTIELRGAETARGETNWRE
jgi:hypothetical protein